MSVVLPDLEQMSALEVLEWAYRSLGGVAIVASLQVESIVLIDLAAQVVERPEVITIDTGRLHQETYDFMEEVRRRWPIRLNVVSPRHLSVQDMVNEHGPNLFRESVELRQLCCDVRKRQPLDSALHGYNAWVTGLRRDQSASRQNVPVSAPDPARRGVTKVAPLAQWTRDRVWRHVEENDLPVHPLYAQSYTSIGCASCTRSIQPGEDERAGRWWWEQDAVKECGLHWSNGVLERRNR
jgi:phosphoadenosine phosphosulfate reductase